MNCECGRKIMVRKGAGRADHSLCEKCYRALRDKTRQILASNKCAIDKAYVSSTGHVTVYDRDGNKIPELCGRLITVGPQIRAAGYTGPIEDFQ